MLKDKKEKDRIVKKEIFCYKCKKKYEKFYNLTQMRWEDEFTCTCGGDIWHGQFDEK